MELEQVLQRRACAVIQLDPKTYRYKSRRPDQAAIEQRIKKICETRVRYGYPQTIRIGQGSEFVSHDLDLWTYHNDVTLDFSRPGKPTDNAFIEAFNGRLRAECLNTHWFLNLLDARNKLECWRREYKEVRPHGAIGNKPLRQRSKSRKTLASGEGKLGSAAPRDSTRVWYIKMGMDNPATKRLKLSL